MALRLYSKPTHRGTEPSGDEVDRYAAEGNNEPIIPEDMFNRVQEERNCRSNVEVGADGVKRRKSTKYSAKAKE